MVALFRILTINQEYSIYLCRRQTQDGPSARQLPAKLSDYYKVTQWDGSKSEDRRYAGNDHIFISIFTEQTPTGPSQAELLLRVTSGIAAELIKAYDGNESVSLNEIRAKLSKKHGFGGVPRLVDIISAIPDDYKKALLPKLKARPIRTASGVSVYFFSFLFFGG